MKRSDFLKTGATAALGAAVLPKWIQPLLAQSDNLRDLTGDRILVIINLGGGNDGLNTVVPFTNDIYYNFRPNIAIQPNQVLPLDDHLGLHPSMQPLMQYWDQGKFLILQNVGYDNQDLSHFRSTDIWRSATDSDIYMPTGWIGRYLEALYTDIYQSPPETPLALQQGSSSSLLLTGNGGTPGVIVDDPSTFYNIVGETYVDGLDNNPPETYGGQELSFIRQIDLNSFQYAEVIQDAAEMGNNQVEYPQSNLGQQLGIIARLISGGMYTPIFLAHHYGYDTHADQPGAHAGLLTDLASSINSLMADLAAQGLSDRVTIISTSEFGRRPFENGSNGTDHGSAAPLFMLGESVNGGILGNNPDMEVFDEYDNLLHQYDFRQVYSTIMKNYFQSSHSIVDQDVLMQTFSTLPLFNIAQPGDANLDGDVNITDVVFMVNIVLEQITPTAEQYAAADFNGDGLVNIMDIVSTVNEILNGGLSKMAVPVNSNQPELVIDNGTCKLNNADHIAGVQLKLSGDFASLTSKLPHGWELHSYQNNVVLFARQPVNLESDQTLFKYSGDLKVEELTLSNYSGHGVTGTVKVIPGNFVLYSAYPNPFNPESKIRFSLSSKQHIKAEVYNLEGRRIKRLTSGMFEAGEHQLTFDGRFVASGVYLLKMKSGKTIQSQKLYLIK